MKVVFNLSLLKNNKQTKILNNNKSKLKKLKIMKKVKNKKIRKKNNNKMKMMVGMLSPSRKRRNLLVSPRMLLVLVGITLPPSPRKKLNKFQLKPLKSRLKVNKLMKLRRNKPKNPRRNKVKKVMMKMMAKVGLPMKIFTFIRIKVTVNSNSKLINLVSPL